MAKKKTYRTGQFKPGFDRRRYQVLLASDPNLKKKSKVGEEVGASGTLITSGFISSEDYNSDLTGVTGIDKFDEMRLGDATVRAAMMAVKLPILSANWFVTPASEDPKDEAIAEFITENLFESESFTWSQFMREALLYLDFGRMVFEEVYEMRDGKIYLKKLAPRLPRTIYQWETQDGETGITQLLPDGKQVSIPIEKLVIFTNEKEGDNWEGISLLRAAYPSWYYKNQLYKIDAIAHERQGVGVPVFRLGESASDQDRTTAEELGKNLRANEEGHYVLEGDVSLEMLDMKAGSARDAMGSILHHDRQIVKSVLAQFLELGATSGSGSRALSEDHSKLFILSLEALAKQTADTINNYVIRRLVDLNFDVKAYPFLEYSAIGQKDLNTMSTALQRLIQVGIIQPDETLEDFVRNEFNLPERPEDGLADAESIDELEQSLNDFQTELGVVDQDLAGDLPEDKIEDQTPDATDELPEELPADLELSEDLLASFKAGASGVPLSEETKRKISEALKRYWSSRKKNRGVKVSITRGKKKKGGSKGRGKKAPSAKTTHNKQIAQNLKKLRFDKRQKLRDYRSTMNSVVNGLKEEVIRLKTSGASKEELQKIRTEIDKRRLEWNRWIQEARDDYDSRIDKESLKKLSEQKNNELFQRIEDTISAVERQLTGS